MSCRRIKLSDWQSLMLNVVETGGLLSDSAQKLGRENADVPDIYFTLLNAAGKILVLNQTAPAREEAGSLSKYENQKLQNLYTQGGVVSGSAQNLVKTSNPAISQVRQLYIENLLTQSLLLLRSISRGLKHLPDSQKKLGIWT